MQMRWPCAMASASKSPASRAPSRSVGGSNLPGLSSSSSRVRTPRAANRRASKGCTPACSRAHAARGGTSLAMMFMVGFGVLLGYCLGTTWVRLGYDLGWRRAPRSERLQHGDRIRAGRASLEALKSLPESRTDSAGLGRHQAEGVTFAAQCQAHGLAAVQRLLDLAERRLVDMGPGLQPQRHVVGQQRRAQIVDEPGAVGPGAHGRRDAAAAEPEGVDGGLAAGLPLVVERMLVEQHLHLA